MEVNDGSDRKSFQNLPREENLQFLNDGKLIYAAMRKKYPNSNNLDLDKVLNGLCAAITCLIYDNVAKDDRMQMLQLVYKILRENL